jgi:hypothetical protein
MSTAVPDDRSRPKFRAVGTKSGVGREQKGSFGDPSSESGPLVIYLPFLTEAPRCELTSIFAAHMEERPQLAAYETEASIATTNTAICRL